MGGSGQGLLCLWHFLPHAFGLGNLHLDGNIQVPCSCYVTSFVSITCIHIF